MGDPTDPSTEYTLPGVVTREMLSAEDVEEVTDAIAVLGGCGLG